MRLKCWVNDSLLISVMIVVDANLLIREEKHLMTKEQRVSFVFNLAMERTVESPKQRINAKEIFFNLQCRHPSFGRNRCRVSFPKPPAKTLKTNWKFGLELFVKSLFGNVRVNTCEVTESFIKRLGSSSFFSRKPLDRTVHLSEIGIVLARMQT
ncbi:hypothetical protein CUMW_260050 [Citrus unshiu]|nr:hypothetical protein CUMW_260050 [Citrus unshiu]